MLIKSYEASVSDTNEVNQEDKLQERLKQENQTEEKLIGGREYSTKYFECNKDRRLKKSSTLDITEITPYLFLCGAIALRGNVLENLKVTCVINATKELPDTPLPPSLQNEILYLRVNVDDKPDSNIFPWLDLVADIIHQVKLVKGKSLIHCVAGVSRSATLCLAYLIKYEGYSLYDSYNMLKSLREIIRPNSGFFGQLVEFEKQKTGKQTVEMVQSNFALSWVPQLYEEDYHKQHMLKCRKS